MDEAKITTHPYTSKVTTKCCYSCEEEGHFSQDCPIKRTRSSAFEIEYDRQELENLLALEEPKKKRKLGINKHHSEPKRDISQVLCFTCNNKGPYANECPEKKAEEAAKGYSLDKGYGNHIKWYVLNQVLTSKFSLPTKFFLRVVATKIPLSQPFASLSKSRGRNSF